MMVADQTRRQLLRILGISTVGSLAGCSALFGGGEGGRRTRSPENYLANELEAIQEADLSAVSNIGFSFAEENRTVEADSSELGISHLEAVPSEVGNGDVLWIVPDEALAKDLVEELELLWGIDQETAEERVVLNEESVELRGGPGLDFAALLGVVPGDPVKTLVIRAESVQHAKEIASSQSEN